MGLYHAGLRAPTMRTRVGGDAGPPAFYTQFLNRLRRETGLVEAESVLAVYDKLRDEYRNPVLADLLSIYAAYLAAGERIADGIGLPAQLYQTRWWTDLGWNAARIREQVMLSRAGGKINPDFEEYWTSLGKFSTLIDVTRDHWDEMRTKNGAEVVRDVIRQIAKGSVKSPIGEAIIEEAKREAKPIWEGLNVGMLAIGGAIIGVTLVIMSANKGTRSAGESVRGYLPETKGKRQAEAVATKIMEKTR